MSTIKANTLLHSDGTSTTQPSIPALDTRFAKAWVNFNGTGVVAIRDSYNVSSITDNGTGNYTINFAVSMSNSNYSAVITAKKTSSWDEMTAAFGHTNSSVVVNNVTGAGVFTDTSIYSVQVMGGQA